MLRGRRVLAGLLGLLFVAGLAPWTSAPAGAVSPLPITCNVAGTLETVSGPELTQWTIIGGGSCQGDLEGTYILPDLVVKGTSTSIGLCGGDGVVRDLFMEVKGGNLVNLANPLANKNLMGQLWGSPVTTYPVATPFLIVTPEGLLGAGTIWTRIFGKCPAVGGTPVMTAQFTFET